MQIMASSKPKPLSLWASLSFYSSIQKQHQDETIPGSLNCSLSTIKPYVRYLEVKGFWFQDGLLRLAALHSVRDLTIRTGWFKFPSIGTNGLPSFEKL